MPLLHVLAHSVARHVVVGPALRATGRVVVSGADHVPRRGPVVLAANHTAIADSFYMALAVRRDVRMLTKHEYFDEPGVIGTARRISLRALGQVPVDRDGVNRSSTVKVAADLLRQGRAWGVHPEGTRTPFGTVHRGHTGVVRAATLAGAPLLPVAINGCHRTPTPWRRVTVDILPPLDLAGVGPNDRDAIRTATDLLMRRLADHLEQRYVDTYGRPAAVRRATG